MTFRTILIPALAVALSAGTDGLAQQSNRQRNRDRQMRAQQQQQRQAGERATAAGEVRRTKKVALRNRNVEHLLVLLRTESGRNAIVDLGPVQQISDATITSGDRLAASGRLARVGDRLVLMADVVRKGGRSFDIERPSPQGQAQQTAFRGQQDRRQQQGAKATGRGRIIRTKKVGIRGRPIEHLVVLVKTDRGNARVVDLGPVKNLSKVKIASGDTIAVSGDVVAVGDKQVLMAHLLRVNGRQIQIERQRPQAAHQQARRSPRQQQEQQRRQAAYR